MRFLPLLCISLSLLLASCVGTQAQAGLNALLGENIKTAYSVIGYPSQKMVIDGDQIYIWGYQNSGTTMMRRTAQSTSYIGTTMVNTTTSYNEYVPFNDQIQIKLVTDKSGKIVDWSYQGNNGGLMAFSRNLNKYAKAKAARQAANQ